MAYRKQIEITPSTITNLTVVVKDNTFFTTLTLDDFTLSDDILTGRLTVSNNNTPISIYSQGYEPIITTFGDLSNSITLTPTSDYIKTSDGTNDYYVKDNYSRQFGNDLLDILSTKADSSDIPAAVTESTVSGWGFTKNTGTVTSVNNIEPTNGNVTISIPDTSNFADKDLSNLSNTGNSKFQTPLESGTNIKTVNNTSLLGSGNIDIKGVLIAEYGVTSFADIQTAYNNGKAVFCNYHTRLIPLSAINSSAVFFGVTDYNGNSNELASHSYRCTSSNVWSIYLTYVVSPERTSNKVTSISSSSTNTQYPSAKCVYDAIQNVYSERNIGQIIQSTIPLTDAGLHLLDGSLIDGSGIYADFVNYIAGIYDSNSNYFCTETEWQQSITNYGVCGKFVYNSTNNTVRLPKITGFIEGTTDITTLGDITEAGLPNILTPEGDGVFRTNTWGENGQSFTRDCFYGTTSKYVYSRTESSSGVADRFTSFNFDASRSNSIYGNSDTVQPQAIKVLYYIVVANSTKTDIEVDIDEIATDLNGKADTDLTNISSTITSIPPTGLKNFDGQWVQSYISLVSGANVTSVTSYNLSSYLPNDDYKYEVILSVNAFTGSSSGNTIACFGGSDLFDFSSSNFLTNAIRITQVRTRTNSNMTSASSCIIPVGSGRVVKLLTPTNISGNDYSKGTITAEILGYRRIGTNS